MILPKDYISVSQVNLWHKNRQEYIQRYFYGMEGETSVYLEFGKRFADNVETFIKDGVLNVDVPEFYLPQLEQYSICECEKPINLTINDLNVNGFIDIYDMTNHLVIDFKTSTKPWTHQMLVDSLQMKIYAVAIMAINDEIPMCQINWLETKKISNELMFTGRSEIVQHKFEMDELLPAIAYVYHTAEEISKEYISFLETVKLN